MASSQSACGLLSAPAEDHANPSEYGAYDTDDEVLAPAYLPRPPKGPRISGCSAHQSTAKDETRSPMDSDDIEADAAQCLQLPAELCPRPPELCPEPSGDEDGLATYSSLLSGVTPEVAHRPMKPGKGRGSQKPTNPVTTLFLDASTTIPETRPLALFTGMVISGPPFLAKAEDCALQSAAPQPAELRLDAIDTLFVELDTAAPALETLLGEPLAEELPRPP